MKKIVILSGLFLLIFLILANVTYAQDGVDESEFVDLEDIELDVPDDVPSSFSMWWRGFKEALSLAVTIDPVKKAQKQLKYAEERFQIAEMMAEQYQQDEKIQARIEKVLQKASEYMEKVADRQDKWWDQKDELEQRLLKNIANHQLRREEIMDSLEEGLPEEVQAEIQAFRGNALENGQRLLMAIENEDMPEEVRIHLEEVNSRIEDHLTEVKEYVQTRQELIEQAKSGDEEVTEELQQLKEQRQETIKNRVRNHDDDEDDDGDDESDN